MAARPRRASTSSQTPAATPAASAEAQQETTATNRITVRIGQLGGAPRVVTGSPGMTVAQVLQQAGLTPGGKSKLMLRGVPIEADTVLDSDVMLIVSGNVSGG